MSRYRKDDEEYDGWGNHAGDSRLSIGNVSGAASKLVWWIMGLVAMAGFAEAAWLGNAVIELKSKVAAIDAKVDYIIIDRRADRGRP